MKRIINLALLVIVASLSAVAVAGIPVKTSDLPKNARTFLTKYFAGDNVRKAEKDQGHRGMEFEVDLQSGAEIDFRENGDWKDVKAAKQSLPALCPQPLPIMWQKNHKGQSIVEILRKRGGYEVELSNGTELKLTENGQPMAPRNGGQHSGHH